MTETKQMVESMLNKYINARSSDEILLDCIITHYFDGDYIEFMSQAPVHFIDTMTRSRRRFQLLWQYLGTKKVMDKRRSYSKYRKSEQKLNKKEIQKVSLLKAKRKWK